MRHATWLDTARALRVGGILWTMTRVRQHTRSDGTHVRGHDRRGREAAPVDDASASTARAEAVAAVEDVEHPHGTIYAETERLTYWQHSNRGRIYVRDRETAELHRVIDRDAADAELADGTIPAADGVPAEEADRYVQAMSALQRAASVPVMEVNVGEAVTCNRTEAIHQLDVMEAAATWSVGEDMAAERREAAEKAWRALWATADADREPREHDPAGISPAGLPTAADALAENVDEASARAARVAVTQAAESGDIEAPDEIEMTAQDVADVEAAYRRRMATEATPEREIWAEEWQRRASRS